MCLTLDTGEAEQTRIVKSTCGEQWGGRKYGQLGGVLFLTFHIS